jgi:hypothetical protein
MHSRGAKCPDDVSGLADRQIRPQSPALGELAGKGPKAMQPTRLDHVQYLSQFRVTVSGGDEHSIERARSALDARLRGCIQLELPTRIGLLDDSPNCRALLGWSFGPL